MELASSCSALLRLIDLSDHCAQEAIAPQAVRLRD
jgi:hypothetical protein